jgi:curved DNA-binding protein CbpA
MRCQEAKEKFQQLQKVISILGDAEKRALYDETGITDDDVSTSFLVLNFLLLRLKQYFLKGNPSGWIARTFSILLGTGWRSCR